MKTDNQKKPAPLFDEELQGIFGNRYTDASNSTQAKKAAQTEPAKNAPKWEATAPAPNWMDKLKGCVKWSALFSGLCGLFFYWQQTGLMDPAAAMPCMLTCAVLTGVSIGKAVTK